MIEKKLQRAILINVIAPERNKEDAVAEFDELMRLVQTYGGIVIMKIIQKRGRPSAKTYVGEGKAQEIGQLVKDLKVDVVVINGFLKANQSNNLINIIPCEVLDRFEMILKIFEKHAISPEAKLQLRIAYLKYEFPKLFGSGAMLSQQAAGVGVRTTGGASGGRRAARGPGETVLETKRRHLRNEIKTLEKKLQQFRQVRSQQRLRRSRNEFFTVALVGYTNSGKSSLLQAITKKKNILVEDKLFSTLDTRLGEIYFEPKPGAAPHGGMPPKILLADTIGFIQNLPPLLFSSFLATLEEVTHAQMLLHVIDISDEQMYEKVAVVEDILNKLGATSQPILYVFNKIDRVSDVVLQNAMASFPQHKKVFISALSKQNFAILRDEIAKVASSHSLTDRTQASGA